MENVLLVNENDEEIGFMEKMAAHQNGGHLHRAFSVFLYKDDFMLLQQRSVSKYHCPLLWTNSCCSHPLSCDIKKYASKRLVEELGIDLSKVNLKEAGTLMYKHTFDNGLTEYEYDHLLISEYNSNCFDLNEKEVYSTKWVRFDELIQDIDTYPTKYTYWFSKCVKEVLEKIKKNK